MASKRMPPWRRATRYAWREVRGQGEIALPGGRRRLAFGSRHCRVQPDYELLYVLARGRRCIFDVGAKVGMTAMTMAAACEDGVVHAFEASEVSCLVLQRNIALNRLGERVKVINTVLGSESGGVLDYHWNLVSGRSGTVMEPPLGATPIRKATTRLDDLAKHAGLSPDLVKIDVEGGEREVLAGMSEILRAAQPDVVLELHAWPGVPPSRHAEAILACLEPAGYVMHWLSRGKVIERAEQLDELSEPQRGVASRARLLLLPQGRAVPEEVVRLELGAIDPG